MIDFDVFANWAKNKFGSENVVTKGKEVRINSIFADSDINHKLWCNPSGGKKKRKNGVFHCWKTNTKGDLVKLVEIVEKIDRSDAIAILHGQKTIGEIEQELEMFVAGETECILEKISSKNLLLPFGCQLISSMSKNNWWRIQAENYLNNRKIPVDNLYVCTKNSEDEEKYKGRIIIPYYDKNYKLIYYNGRHIWNDKFKYKAPPKSIGVGKEDVIYMAGDWPIQGSVVHLCEGEFNAMTLKLCELNAAACGGKHMCEKHLTFLAGYKIVLCLDRDKAGREGASKMASILSMFETNREFDKLQFVFPPPKYNDWNSMLQETSPAMIYHYITKNKRTLDPSTPYASRLELMTNALIF